MKLCTTCKKREVIARHSKCNPCQQAWNHYRKFDSDFDWDPVVKRFYATKSGSILPNVYASKFPPYPETFEKN